MNVTDRLLPGEQIILSKKANALFGIDRTGLEPIGEGSSPCGRSSSR
jgi:hypothetical protein